MKQVPIFNNTNAVKAKSLAIFLLVTFMHQPNAMGQKNCINIRDQYAIASTCSQLFLTSRHDQTGKPYLYVAAKEGGLKIFKIASSPVLIASISITSLKGLHVMNLSQSGNYVYLALGNHFGTAGQSPGFAIIDISDPEKPLVASVWTGTGLIKTGAGIIETLGNYAYLGAMQNGLMIFDISDKNNPGFVSKIIPSINFPDARPDQKKINARGLTVKNNMLYLCYDAGGLRIINIADKKNPREAGHYSNPVMNKKPRAYNNIVVNDSLAYIAVDYCGLEVLNINDTSGIKQVSWWNPWSCEKSALNWFTSPGHTNEIAMDIQNKLIFLSSGKSDMQVVNVSNPAAPVFCAEYGGTNNRIGTWGVSLYEKNIYLSYICSIIPFSSNWPGIKILQY